MRRNGSRHERPLPGNKTNDYDRMEMQKFEELSVHELYAIMRLRSEVFVLEQNCAYLDADNKDQECWHFAGWHNNSPVAYVRLVPAGRSFKEPSIGRVVTSPAHRKGGHGRVLMQKLLNFA